MLFFNPVHWRFTRSLIVFESRSLEVYPLVNFRVSWFIRSFTSGSHAFPVDGVVFLPTSLVNGFPVDGPFIELNAP